MKNLIINYHLFQLAVLAIIIGSLTTQQVHAQRLSYITPDVEDVFAIKQAGNTVYIGGKFREINGEPRKGLARYDAKTGELSDWTPISSMTGSIDNMEIVADKIVVTGSFQEINDEQYLGICIFDLETGAIVPFEGRAMYPGWRSGICARGNVIYYVNRNPHKIVAYDVSTASFLDWETDEFRTAHGVNQLFIEGNHLYVGGDFYFISGDSRYNHLCRFDLTTGALDTDWIAGITDGGNFGVTAIVKTNNAIFVGGSFSEVAGQARKGVAAYDLEGNLLPWSQSASSHEVLNLAADGDFIWVGSNAWKLGGKGKYRIAQLREDNAEATCWDISYHSQNWSTIHALSVSGDTVILNPIWDNKLQTYIGNPLPAEKGEIEGPTIVQGGTTSRYSTPPNSAYSYTWSVTGGTVTNMDDHTINVEWGSMGFGTITLIVDNPSAWDCYQKTSIEVMITGATSTEKPLSEQISLLPNPCNDHITLNIPSVHLKEINVQLFDSFGKRIKSIAIEKEQYTINISEYPSGMYYLSIEGENERTVEKLVKF